MTLTDWNTLTCFHASLCFVVFFVFPPATFHIANVFLVENYVKSSVCKIKLFCTLENDFNVGHESA